MIIGIQYSSSSYFKLVKFVNFNLDIGENFGRGVTTLYPPPACATNRVSHINLSNAQFFLSCGAKPAASQKDRRQKDRRQNVRVRHFVSVGRTGLSRCRHPSIRFRRSNGLNEQLRVVLFSGRVRNSTTLMR
jgi:hypothetical protein